MYQFCAKCLHLSKMLCSFVPAIIQGPGKFFHTLWFLVGYKLVAVARSPPGPSSLLSDSAAHAFQQPL